MYIMVLQRKIFHFRKASLILMLRTPQDIYIQMAALQGLPDLYRCHLRGLFCQIKGTDLL